MTNDSSAMARLEPQLGGQLVGIRPVGESFRLGPEEGIEIGEGETAHCLVFRAGENCQPVCGNVQLDIGDPGSLTPSNLLFGDGTRCVGDVGLAGAEPGETITCPGSLDGSGDAGIRSIERLPDSRRDRLDGGRPGHDNAAREVAAGSALGEVAGSSVAAVVSDAASVVSDAAPDVVVSPDPSPPQAARTRARAPSRAKRRMVRDFIPFCSFFVERSPIGAVGHPTARGERMGRRLPGVCLQ